MIGTVLSIFIAGFFLWSGFVPQEWAKIIIALFSLTLFALEEIASLSFWRPLQKLEQKLAPHLIQALSRDWRVRFGTFYFRFFLLFSLFVAVLQPGLYLLSLWVISFGFGIDLFYRGISYRSTYLNPYEVIEFYRENAGKAIVSEEDDQFLVWLDALAETALKAVDRHSPSLSREALNRMHLVIRDYLQSLKSIAHTSAEEGDSSRVSYSLLFLLQRFDMINKRAIDEPLEQISSDLMGALGKVSLDAAAYDMTMASLPIHFLGRLSIAAQKAGFEDASGRATLTFLEMSKMMIEEVEVQYVDLKEPFLSIIGHMHELAKATFKKDKEMNITLLIQPFLDLKELFSHEKVKDHPDSRVIISSIDSVIGEFNALAAVMSTLPSFSEEKEEKEEEGVEESGE